MASNQKRGTERQELRNSVNTLFSNIRFMSPDEPIKSIVITSSVPNEGKTEVAVELARAIEQAGNHVLLVETDMRRRSVGSRLGVHPTYGLYSVISGEQAAGDVVVAIPGSPGLFFLDAEPHIPNPVSILGSQRFQKLVARMEASFDYVIFDTPPVGTFVDAAMLSTIADATIMVARVGEVKRDELQGAYEQLQQAGGNVIGVCATFCESKNTSYYYYYSSDGSRSKKKKKKK